MAALTVFKGSIEELIARREEFAGMHLKIEAAPKKTKTGTTAYPPPEEVKTVERINELLMEARASPSREMTAEDWAEPKRLYQASAGLIFGKQSGVALRSFALLSLFHCGGNIAARLPALP